MAQHQSQTGADPDAIQRVQTGANSNGGSEGLSEDSTSHYPEDEIFVHGTSRFRFTKPRTNKKDPKLQLKKDVVYVVYVKIPPRMVLQTPERSVEVRDVHKSGDEAVAKAREVWAEVTRDAFDDGLTHEHRKLYREKPHLQWGPGRVFGLSNLATSNRQRGEYAVWVEKRRVGRTKKLEKVKAFAGRVADAVRRIPKYRLTLRVVDE